MGNSKSSSNIYEIPNQNINCKKGHKLTFQAENSYSSASFQCNICKHTSKSCQSSCFVCKTCKFYCCWYCNIVIDYSFKNYQKITCNANHELHPCTSVPYSGGQFECDICRKLSDPNEFCMRCDMCKYDICITCASCFGDNKFKLTKNFINYSSEVKCEKSHQLKYASTVPYESLYYICNYCTRYSNIKAAAVRCDKCKYDLCISCYYIRYKLAMGSKKLPDEVNIQNENKANISDAIASLSENKIDGFVTIDDRQKKSHNDNNNNNNNNSSNINIIKNNTIFHDVFVLNSNSNTNNKVYDNNGMNVFSSNDNPRLGHPNNNAHEKINNHKGNNNVDTNVNNVDISNVVNMNSNIVPGKFFYIYDCKKI